MFPVFLVMTFSSQPDHIGGGGFGAVLGGRNWKRFFKKTRVGFGRTELSLRAIGTTFCALSSGHGPVGLGFQGGDFHVF